MRVCIPSNIPVTLYTTSVLTTVIFFVIIACVHFHVSPLNSFFFFLRRYDTADDMRGGSTSATVHGKTSTGGSALCLSPSPWSLVARECPFGVYELLLLLLSLLSLFIIHIPDAYVYVWPRVLVGPIPFSSTENIFRKLQSSNRRVRWSQKVNPSERLNYDISKFDDIVFFIAYSNNFYVIYVCG